MLRPPPPEIPSDWSDELVAAFDQWLQYKSERKEKYVPSGLQALVRKISKHPPEAVIWAIEDAMGKNYQGFFPENYRVPGRGGQPQRSNNEIIGTALKNILKQDAENGIDITGEIPASIINLWT